MHAAYWNKSLEDEIDGLRSKIKTQHDIIQRQSRELYDLITELTKIKNQYEQFYHLNSTCFFTLDEQFEILNLNNEAATLLNSPPSALVGTRLLNYFDDYGKTIFRKKIKVLLKKKLIEIFEVPIFVKELGKIYLVLQCILTENQDIQVNAINITSLRQAEAKFFDLQNSYNTINTLFQNANEAIALLDSHFNFKVFNKAFINAVSHIFSAKLGFNTNFKLIITNVPGINKQILTTCEQLQPGQHKKIKIENICEKIENIYSYDLTIEKILNNAKEVEYIFSFLDVSEYKRHEIQERKEQALLARLSKTKALNEMRTTVAHELIQPLTAIKTYCYGSMVKVKDNKDHCGDLIYPLEKIALHTSHATELVQRLKNFMCEEKLFFEKSNLHEIIKKALDYLFFESANLKLTFQMDLDEYIPDMLLDRLKVMQLIINLGRNSIDALQDTGEIQPKIVIKTEFQNDFVSVNFRDNGPGISQDIYQKLLHAPYTSKTQGMGLGLSICRAIVRSHGGIFDVKQHKETGAWFYFTFPTNKWALRPTNGHN